jgi:hypothetical protein
MQRRAPNSSIVVCIQGLQAAASASEEGGSAASSKPMPLMRMPRPPSFTCTFGQVASSVMLAFHPAKTSFRLPA